MQNNIFSKVNVSTRILILLLISIIILIANSMYLLTFMSIYFVTLALLTNKSVKFYIETIKNVNNWLLFVFIAYIIIFRNILNSTILTYKIILIVLYVKQFSLTVNFSKLVSGIRTIFKFILKKENNKFIYSLVIFIYFVKYFIESKKIIKAKYSLSNKLRYNFSLKYNILPRVFLSISKINKLESTLKLKFNNYNLEENKKSSNFVLYVFLLLFIVAFFKEVIM